MNHSDCSVKRQSNPKGIQRRCRGIFKEEMLGEICSVTLKLCTYGTSNAPAR